MLTTLFYKNMVQSLPQSDSFRILFNSPELSEVQRSGFHYFLKKGIVEELSKISCIQVKNAHFLVEIVIDAQNFQLVTPETNYRDCILKLKSYTCKLYVQAKIFFKDKVSEQVLYKTEPEWVLLADLPIMTKRGHFVINGSPRVIVHQVGRAPGIYFKKILKQKKDINNKTRFYCDIIPRKGVWVRLQINKKGEIDFKLKKSKKIRAEMVEKCLELLEKEESFLSFQKRFSALQKPNSNTVRVLDQQGVIYEPFKFKALLAYTKTKFLQPQFAPNLGELEREKLWGAYPSVLDAKETPYLISKRDTPISKEIKVRFDRESGNGNGNRVVNILNSVEPNSSLSRYLPKRMQMQPFFSPQTSLLMGGNLDNCSYSKTWQIQAFITNSGFPATKYDSDKANGQSYSQGGGKFFAAEKEAFANVYASFYKNETFWAPFKSNASPLQGDISGLDDVGTLDGKRSLFAKERGSVKGVRSVDKSRSLSKKVSSFAANKKPLKNLKKSNEKSLLTRGSTTEVQIRSIQSSVTTTALGFARQKGRTPKAMQNEVLQTKGVEPLWFAKRNFSFPSTKGLYYGGFIKESAQEVYLLQPHLKKINKDSKKAKLPKKKLAVKKHDLYVNLSKIHEYLHQLFKRSDLYDLGRYGREKINNKFGISVTGTQLTALDIKEAINWLSLVRAGKKEIDDIDHSQNRRVRTSSELIQAQLEVGMYRLKNFITKKIRNNTYKEISEHIFIKPDLDKTLYGVGLHLCDNFYRTLQKQNYAKDTTAELAKRSARLLPSIEPVSGRHKVLHQTKGAFFAPNQNVLQRHILSEHTLQKTFIPNKDTKHPWFDRLHLRGESTCFVSLQRKRVDVQGLAKRSKAWLRPDSYCLFLQSKITFTSINPYFIKYKKKYYTRRYQSENRDILGLRLQQNMIGERKSLNKKLYTKLNLALCSPRVLHFMLSKPLRFTCKNFVFATPSFSRHSLKDTNRYVACKPIRAFTNPVRCLQKTKFFVSPVQSEALRFANHKDPFGAALSSHKILGRNQLYDSAVSEMFSTKPINGALREFFSASPLSQYMDQSNPLAEITHKRRISSLGIGGVSRESAGMTIRGIHPTHYGRICPIETPEGKNAGLVNSLAFYAKINNQGFIETPYYQVLKGQIQHELGFSFYSAEQETLNGFHIAPNDITQSKSKLLGTNTSTVESIPVRVADNLLDLFKKVNPYRVNCIGISPVQILSVATSLIPFLEHNDANRALMGSNMQRQAVPLMISERPLVGTGLEARVLAESGHPIQSKVSGFISNISAHGIVVERLLHQDVRCCAKQSIANPKGDAKLSRYLQKLRFCIAGRDANPKAQNTNPKGLYSICKDPKKDPKGFVRNDLPKNATLPEIGIAQASSLMHLKRVKRTLNRPISKLLPYKPLLAGNRTRIELSNETFVPPFNRLFDGIFKNKNKGVFVNSVRSRAHAGRWPSRTIYRARKNATPADIYNFEKDTFIKNKFTLLPVIHSITTFSRSNQETCLIQKPLIEEGDWVQKGDMISECSAGQKGELSVGRNMLIAYIPWQGYNFEDAIVISDRLIREQLYTSLHIERYTVAVNDFKDKIADTNEWFTGNLPGIALKKTAHLQKSGLPVVGTILKEGDILVGKIKYSKKKPATPHEKLVCDILGEQNFSVQNTSLYVPKGVHLARVLTYKIKKRFDKSLKNNLRPAGAPKIVHIFLGEKRNIQVGDKMSGRHGNKGIVSTILPLQNMPYLADGTPIDILLNPLGVPSRMNVGQVFECLLGLASTYLHQNFKVTAFDELYGTDASQSLVFLKIYQARLQSGQNWLFQVNFPGKTRLIDGRSGECFDQWVTVGRAYMLKLIHMVNEKIHARAIGPYALVTQQPLKGRAHKGGQRLGEMEVWAVEGFGAAYILQELLTKKSDDSIGRKEVLKAMLPKPSHSVSLTKLRFTPFCKTSLQKTSDYSEGFTLGGGKSETEHLSDREQRASLLVRGGGLEHNYDQGTNDSKSKQALYDVSYMYKAELPSSSSLIDEREINSAYLSKGSIFQNIESNTLGQPDIFKVLICELQALCLDVGVYSMKTKSFQRKFLGVFE